MFDVRRFLTLVSFFLLCFTTSASVEEEDDVVVLNDKNFDEWVNAQTFTLVEFYAPWCGHCKSLAPEWSKAAKYTKTLAPPVYLAKVDADEHKDLAQRFGVEGYPTIFAFRNGVKDAYEGPREADGIIEYVEKEGPPSFDSIKTVAEATAFVKENEMSVLGIFRQPFSSGKMFQAFRAASKTLKNKGTSWAFAAEGESKYDHTVGKYVPSAVGDHYGTGMGVLVFEDYGKSMRSCNIKPKAFSEKKLIKCITEKAKDL